MPVDKSELFGIVCANESRYPVVELCRLLGVSASGYYAWRARRPSRRTQADVALGERVETILCRSGLEYGRPRIKAELAAAGIRVGNDRLARLLRERRTIATAGVWTGRPVRIGLLLPLSGPSAAIGHENLRGFQYVMDAAGHHAGGKRIQIIVADDQNSPSVALNEARRMVESEHVVALVGSLSSTVGFALSEYAACVKVPYIAGPTATDLTGAKKNPYTFRASSEAHQFQAPLAEFLKRRGFRRGILMGQDYVTGHDTLGGLARNFRNVGGTVVKEVFAAPGDGEYARCFQDLGDQRADFMFGFFFGGEALRFVRAYRASGLRMPLALTGSTISAGNIAQQLGRDVEGIYTNEAWMWTLSDPASRVFIDGYRKKYRRVPGTLAALGYDQAMIVLESLRALDGDVRDGAALAAAVRSVRFRKPGGQEFRFDENHDPSISEWLVHWAWRGGRAVPQVIDVMRDITGNRRRPAAPVR